MSKILSYAFVGEPVVGTLLGDGLRLVRMRRIYRKKKFWKEIFVGIGIIPLITEFISWSFDVAIDGQTNPGIYQVFGGSIPNYTSGKIETVASRNGHWRHRGCTRFIRRMETKETILGILGNAHTDGTSSSSVRMWRIWTFDAYSAGWIGDDAIIGAESRILRKKNGVLRLTKGRALTPAKKRAYFYRVRPLLARLRRIGNSY